MRRAQDALQRQALTLLVLLGVTAGLVVIVVDRPIRGSYLLGGSLVAAGLARTVVSERRAGLLVNRGRMTDAVTLTAIGLAVIVLATSLRRTYSGA